MSQNGIDLDEFLDTLLAEIPKIEGRHPSCGIAAGRAAQYVRLYRKRPGSMPLRSDLLTWLMKLEQALEADTADRRQVSAMISALNSGQLVQGGPV